MNLGSQTVLRRTPSPNMDDINKIPSPHLDKLNVLPSLHVQHSRSTLYLLCLQLKRKTEITCKQREDKKRQRMYASTFYFHLREVVGQSTQCTAFIPIGRFEQRIFSNKSRGQVIASFVFFEWHFALEWRHRSQRTSRD